MKNNFKVFANLSSIVAFWHALEKTWPKQAPWKFTTQNFTFHNWFEGSS